VKVAIRRYTEITQGEANMLNDIKLTTLNPATPGKAEPTARSRVADNSQGAAADVTLTPHLDKLASALSTTDEAACAKRAEKLASLKTLLHNDEYKVDMSTLAKRLSQCSLLR
jgi:anti-sigma28 factor (negative regulator of flagellin synthesis)